MNILITGASSGVGYQLALEFAGTKANTVIAIARRGDRLDELQSKAAFNNIFVLKTDLNTFNDKPLLDFLDHHNIKNIDILVHNAGCLVKKPFEEITASEWHLVYGTNVFGPALLTGALLSRLGKNARPSHVVMISSIGGVSGTQKFPGLAAYSSSKGALGILAEVLSEELREKNIRVNTIALGSVQTEMLEKAFPGYVAGVGPEEVSEFICRFCTEGHLLFNGKTLQMSTGTP